MKYIGILIILAAIVGVVIWARHAPATPVPPEAVEATTDQSTQPATTTPPAPTNSPAKPLSTKTTTDGMKIEITKEGTGVAITSGQTATVDYVGKLADGSVFDASKNHGTTGFSFPLGGGQVIKGWDEGVVGMKVGEVRVLTIPPELGYGPSGYPPVIPPNATLTFEVTLLAIK